MVKTFATRILTSSNLTLDQKLVLQFFKLAYNLWWLLCCRSTRCSIGCTRRIRSRLSRSTCCLPPHFVLLLTILWSVIGVATSIWSGGQGSSLSSRISRINGTKHLLLIVAAGSISCPVHLAYFLQLFCLIGIRESTSLRSLIRARVYDFGGDC